MKNKGLAIFVSKERGRVGHSEGFRKEWKKDRRGSFIDMLICFSFFGVIVFEERESKERKESSF